MVRKRKKNFLVMAMLVIVLGGLSLFAYILRQTELTTKDSAALYGGELESKYLSAGYLIAYVNNQPSELCGLVYLNGGMALSAAHCLDKGDKYTAGVGQFNVLTFGDIQISSTTQHSGWDHRKSTYDVGKLSLSSLSSKSVSETARIVEPKQNCNYRIVAYGRTETDGDQLDLNRPRKGADICITAIDEEVFYINSASGGICVGDSGSPIFEKGTNNVVGIISAIRAKDTSSPCYVGNTAIVVRLDTKSEFINDVSNIQPGITEAPSQDITSQFTQVIVDNNLSIVDQAQKLVVQYSSELQIVVYMLGIGIIFFILLLLVDRKNPSYG